MCFFRYFPQIDSKKDKSKPKTSSLNAQHEQLTTFQENDEPNQRRKRLKMKKIYDEAHDDKDEAKIEKVKNVRKRKGLHEYLVKWQGNDECNWITKNKIKSDDFHHIISFYEEIMQWE